MDGRRGFTLVELVFVIGILAVLVGLLLPSLESVVVNARRTRAMAQTRQNMLLIDLFASDHDDQYPLASTEQMASAKYEWYQPLIDAGVASSLDDVGKYDGPLWNLSPTTFELSECVVRRPETMVPGDVPVRSAVRPSIVRRHDVSFPSRKGIIFQYSLPYESRYIGRVTPMQTSDGRHIPTPMAWCCALPVTAPIGFGDGSVYIYSYRQLLKQALVVENGVGYPVISTWYGCRGVDRD